MSRRPGKRAWLAVALGLVSGLTMCRDATQVTLSITTDIPCEQWKAASITVGRPSEIETKQPVGNTAECTSGAIGTLVLVPSAADGPFAVKVVGGDPAKCTAPLYGPGCIVARRSLDFVPDTALTLSIPLRSTCAGVRCGAQDTCVDGKCRSAVVPSPETCVGARGCEEGVLGAPTVADCASLGPADSSCWDVSATFDVASYPNDRENGLHVFGERATAGQTVYAYLDNTSDSTRTSSKVTCGGSAIDLSGGFDIERHFNAAAGAYTITVSGRSAADCGQAAGSQCAGSIHVNPARGWRIKGGRCNITTSGPFTEKDALGRPTDCNVDTNLGTTVWHAGSYCSGCCDCPNLTAYVDIQLSLVRP